MKVYQLDDTSIAILMAVFQKSMLEAKPIDPMLERLEFVPTGEYGNRLTIQNPPTHIQIPNEDDEPEDEDLETFKEFEG